MGTISQLLRYKTEITLRNPKDNKPLGKVWVRILGDDDVKRAYREGRRASADYRAKLLDKTSTEYKIEVQTLADQDDEDLYSLILAAKVNEFTRESVAVVAREELPKIDEIAIEPDAPSLKEQEELDKEEDNTEKRFIDAINKYVEERKAAYEAELKQASHEQLVKLAEVEIVEMAPTQAFLEELANQRGYYATFEDKECKKRAFEDVEDFRNTESNIKKQILDAYNELEMGPDEIKN